MKLKITGQSIEWLDSDLTVSGSDGIYEVEFVFEDGEDLPSWGDLTKYAVYKNTALPEYEGVYMPISEGKALIPAMILASPGRLSVGVYGQNGYYTMPTIWAKAVQVDAGCAEGREAVPQVMTQAQNAIKYGENAKVYALGGYIVTKVAGTIGNPDITRQSEYTKGAKQYALDAAESAEGASASEAAAASSEQNAAASESNAAGSASAAAASAANAAASEISASRSAGAAASSEQNAAASESNAAGSASAAAESERKAAEYAAAAQTVVDSNFLLVDEDDGNAKYMVTLFARDNHLGIGLDPMPTAS